MVVQENVTLILSVCKLKEGGKLKCHKYWPNKHSVEEEDFKSIDGIHIQTVKVTSVGDNLVERVFKVKDTESDKEIVVKQMHYVGWPDHGTPSGESILD